jgi:hypothetical protein
MIYCRFFSSHSWRRPFKPIRSTPYSPLELMAGLDGVRADHFQDYFQTGLMPVKYLVPDSVPRPYYICAPEQALVYVAVWGTIVTSKAPADHKIYPASFPRN